MTNVPEESAPNFVEFDLAHELAEAEQKKPWPAGRYSQSLVKTEAMRIVMISMDKGAELKEHHVDGPISVQVLKGAVKFAAAGKEQILKTGNVIMLRPSIKHEVEALEDSAFLLTISWPEASRLEAMKHRGYGK
jgi:quercetin dioxygenase-like cupin family protein